MRDAARVLTFVVAGVAIVWGVSLVFVDGLNFRVAGFRITSNDPIRPLIVAVAMAASFVALGGRMSTLHGWARRLRQLDERVLVCAVAVAVTGVGVAYATTTASASDAYGYVSQVDGWLRGNPSIVQPIVEDMTWSSRRWSMSPLGYRPSDDGQQPWTIVPVYAPGLPLLMAIGKVIGGQEGMFWVVPIAGGLLVAFTYGIGRRLQARAAGVIGACLVATSPAVLFMLMAPMTDVPVAACWTAATYFLLGTGRSNALLAGLSAALATLIRPNLVVLAVPLGLLYVVRIVRGAPGKRIKSFVDGVVFSLGVLPGIAAVAVINNWLYGSPLVSGYGNLEGMFDPEHVAPNARNYFVWLATTHTPLAFAGIVAIVVPTRWLWPMTRARELFVPVAAFVLVLWAYYCLYLVFEEWWYLRFVLGLFPMVFVGVGAVAVAMARSGGRIGTAGAAVLVMFLCGYGAWQSSHFGVLQIWKSERRYVAAAKLVERYTDENSVILSMIHSGSLRYYAGRATLRYDTLERDRLDRAVAWFANRGVRVFLFVEDWELPDVRDRFKDQRMLERLSDPPVLTYQGAATILLYEISSPRDPLMASDLFPIDETGYRSVPPAPAPPLLSRRFPR